MASQSQGIQQLLRAEKAAAEKVNEARKRKARRLKQAKDEAQREVEIYRSQREQQFKQYEAEHMGTRTDIAQRIDTETAAKLKEMESRVKGSQGEVINLLLQYVCDVKPQLHRNINSGAA